MTDQTARPATAVHHDFTQADQTAIVEFFATHTPGRGEIVLIVAGDRPRAIGRLELADTMRADGLKRVARAIEQYPVPAGGTLCILLGDEVRLKVWPPSLAGGGAP